MIKSRISPPMQLALIFLLFGISWIIFTDGLLVSFANSDVSVWSRLQMYKGVLFMVMGAVFIFFVSRTIINRQSELQEELNKERIRYKNELAIEIFNAQEIERKKLGEELHDNINQLLGVVKLYIEHAHMNPAAREEMLSRSSEYLQLVISEIRTLSKSLVSPALADIGLLESINELIHSILKIKNIVINVSADSFTETVLSSTQKLMIYRITQEQLNNILKHSRAEHVDIELVQNNGDIRLIIEDDGVGFDTEVTSTGLGLKNMRHRLEMVNGQMSIESAPQEGCRLEARFRV